MKDAFPLKLLEFIAAGINIVSVDLESIGKWGKYINIAKSKEEFIKKIKENMVLKKNNKLLLESMKLAQRNSWDSKVKIISNVIEKLYD